MFNEDNQKQLEDDEQTNCNCSNCGEVLTEQIHNECEVNSNEIDFKEQLSAKKEELDELNNRYLRLQADFENYRRRSLLEKEGLVEMVTEHFVKDFLPVVDNFERAVDSAKTIPNLDSLIQGLEMAINKFQEELAKKKVLPVTVKIGEQFDPESQEVIMIEHTENYPDNTVIEELQKGYTIETKFGIKLIRPALVKITKLPE